MGTQERKCHEREDLVRARGVPSEADRPEWRLNGSFPGEPVRSGAEGWQRKTGGGSPGNSVSFPTPATTTAALPSMLGALVPSAAALTLRSEGSRKGSGEPLPFAPPPLHSPLPVPNEFGTGLLSGMEEEEPGFTNSILRFPYPNEAVLTLLRFHATFFPPPPPPVLPAHALRDRALLWYHFASKWDQVTRHLPPPPRSPLPEIKMEMEQGLPPLSRVPYYGMEWIEQCYHWFHVVQSLFDYPHENTVVPIHPRVVLEKAALGP